MLIAVTIVVTALCVIIGLNFVPSEKQIERRVGHTYGLSSPQFTREMGTLLGPAILPGNRVENLENGAEIFPAMLAEIRKAQRSITFETWPGSSDATADCIHGASAFCGSQPRSGAACDTSSATAAKDSPERTRASARFTFSHAAFTDAGLPSSAPIARCIR